MRYSRKGTSIKVAPRIIQLIPILILTLISNLIGLDPNKAIDRYLVDNWRIAQGLPSDTINAITQTADGYIWIGTTKALIRFDGFRFKTIHSPGFLPSEARITSLLVDKKGILWIGTSNGLLSLNRENESTFSNIPELEGKTVSALCGDIKGRLWIGTLGHSVYRLEEKEISHFQSPEELSALRISSIFEDIEGGIWLGAQGDGLFKFRAGKFVRVKIEGFSSGYTINSVFEDTKGTRWRGTNRGLLATRGRQTRIFTSVIGGLSNNDVKTLFEDTHGNLWTGTANGVNRIQESGAGKTSIDKILENSVVTCFYEDQEGSLWVGTNGSGLKRIRAGGLTTYTREHGLPNNYVYSLAQGSGQEIWIGTGYGLTRFLKGNFYPLPVRNDNPKKAMCTDNQGNLWVGTGGSGIFRVKDEESFGFPPPGQKLVHNHILALMMDNEGALWIGTERGLNIYKNGEILTYTTAQGLVDDRVTGLYRDRQNNIWVGTSRGVTLVKDGVFIRQNLEKRLLGVPVLGIYQDLQNTFWICTDGEGLKRIKDKQEFSFTLAHGLGSNTLYQVLEDHRGNLWISSDSGILKVNKIDLHEFARGNIDQINCTSFGISDGMKSIECSTSSANSAAQSRDGKLYFATKMGMTVVDPDRTTINKTPPRVIIEELLFDGKPSLGAGKENRLSLKGKKTGDILIHYTATTFISPAKVIFKYKLTGHDENCYYPQPGSRRTVFYPDLPPGDYSFTITAANSDGVWNNTGDEISFAIRQDFFDTGFSRLLLLLAILGLFFIGYLFFKKRAFQREEKYKTSSLDRGKAEENTRKIIQLLEVDKVYRDENISLHMMAEKLEISVHHLSQVINENLHINFIGLINRYRVEEAQKRLLDPAYSHLSVLGIAFEVGFNSKAAFNRAFKKYAGMTPSEYRKKHPLG